MSQLPHVEIYCDGACKGNPGPGGWGVLLRMGGHERQLKGAEILTTNNRMELTAAYMALHALKKSCRVDLYSDSQYLRQGITEWIKKWKKNGWVTHNKTPVKNVDLWEKLDALIVIHAVHWHWVKGHSGHPENELVDELARSAIQELL